VSLQEIAVKTGVDPICVETIAKWEGCLKKVPGQDLYKPYPCPANVPTVGYGTIQWEDGRYVKLSDPPINKARCEELLAFEIGRRYAPAVDSCKLPFKYGNQRSACISFTLNVGSGGFKKSTLRWLIQQGRHQDAAKEFMRWTRGGGRVLPGLVNRRRDEQRLFLTPGGTLPTSAPELVATLKPGAIGTVPVYDAVPPASPPRSWLYHVFNFWRRK